METNSVSIIGAGELGTALAGLIRSRTSLPVSVWDIDPARSGAPGPLSSQVAPLIFYCAPAASLRHGLTELRTGMDAATGVVIFCKGLEPETGKTSHQIADEVLGTTSPYALLGGPFLAEELADGTSAVTATADPAFFSRLEGLFSSLPIHLERSADLQGVAVAGVTKNIYSLLLGMADALGCGSNIRASLLTGMIKEMGQVCQDLGGTAETAQGLAGTGDLLATGLSPHSANFQAGRHLITHPHGPFSDSEGARALRAFPLSARPYPFLQAAYRAFIEQEPPQSVLASLIG